MFPVDINQNVVWKASKVSAVFKMFFLYANNLTLKTEILFWNPSLSYYCISSLWLSNVRSLMKPNPLNATAASHWQQIKNKVSVISSKPQTLVREKRTRSCLRRSTRSTLGPRTWGTRATSWRYWPRWPRPCWPRPLNDDTKILTETDTETFFNTKFSGNETETFFPRPNSPKPKQILFFEDQIF